jgi:hypothetical protein
MKAKLLHWVFGHKIYYIRTYQPESYKGADINIYRCLWCEKEFESGVYWFLYDKQGRRIR